MKLSNIFCAFFCAAVFLSDDETTTNTVGGGKGIKIANEKQTIT